jgi:hypothetical protein
MAAFGAIVDQLPPSSKYEIRFAGNYADPDSIDGMQSYIDFPATTNFMRLGRAPLAISSSTNASPIAMTVTAHGYVTNDVVTIRGHTVNTNANGTWTIAVTGPNTFTLNGSTGNGVGGATGHVVRLGLRIKPDGSLDVYGTIQADAFTSRLRGQGRSLLQALTYEIPNAEFDLWDTPTQPTAWTVDTGDSSSCAQETSVVFAGDNACKYSFGAGGSAGTFRGLTTNDPVKGAFCIPLHPGTWYQFKFASCVSSMASSPSYRVTLTHNVAGSLTSQKTFSYRAANRWQVDYFKFLVPATAENRTKLAIEFSRNSTTGTDFWLDGTRMQDKGMQRTVILTGSTSWPVPSDFNPAENKIEAIAGGGGAGGSTQNTRSSGGGGGGGYGYKLNFDPGTASTITYAIGGGGPGGGSGATNGTAGGSTTWNAATLATGGGGGQGAGGSSGGGGGGVGAGATGGFAGGTGGNGGAGTSFGGGGGGGAGGPTGAGGTGGNGTSAPAGGSAGAAGTGGGWTDTDSGSTAAVGAGGAGGSGGAGGAGNSYGGGSGGTGCNPGSSFSGNNGAAGVIILSWRTP